MQCSLFAVYVEFLPLGKSLYAVLVVQRIWDGRVIPLQCIFVKRAWRCKGLVDHLRRLYGEG